MPPLIYELFKKVEEIEDRIDNLGMILTKLVDGFSEEQDHNVVCDLCDLLIMCSIICCVIKDMVLTKMMIIHTQRAGILWSTLQLCFIVLNEIKHFTSITWTSHLVAKLIWERVNEQAFAHIPMCICACVGFSLLSTDYIKQGVKTHFISWFKYTYFYNGNAVNEIEKSVLQFFLNLSAIWWY